MKLQHQGYYGTIEYNEIDEVLHRRVLNISDLVSYEGESVAEVKKNFIQSVEGYMEMCREFSLILAKK